MQVYVKTDKRLDHNQQGREVYPKRFTQIINGTISFRSQYSENNMGIAGME